MSSDSAVEAAHIRLLRDVRVSSICGLGTHSHPMIFMSTKWPLIGASCFCVGRFTDANSLLWPVVQLQLHLNIRTDVDPFHFAALRFYSRRRNLIAFEVNVDVDQWPTARQWPEKKGRPQGCSRMCSRMCDICWCCSSPASSRH